MILALQDRCLMSSQVLHLIIFPSWKMNPCLWQKGRYQYDSKVIIILPHQCLAGLSVT